MGTDPPRVEDGGRGRCRSRSLRGRSAIRFAAAVLEAVSPGGGHARDRRARSRAPAIGGPLYPPVHAFLYAPLATLRPPAARTDVFQVIALAFVFVAALGVKVLTRGRIWWSVATIGLSALLRHARGARPRRRTRPSRSRIAIWGWALAARGYNTAGGVVWGLFAFKPVWALAFFLVPLLTRRWRFCAAMVVTGVALCAATLPVRRRADVARLAGRREGGRGPLQREPELDQPEPRPPGHSAADSPRLQRCPRPSATPRLAKVLAWALWGAVFATTVGVYLRYADHRRATGIGAGFLFLGAWSDVLPLHVLRRAGLGGRMCGALRRTRAVLADSYVHDVSCNAFGDSGFLARARFSTGRSSSDWPAILGVCLVIPAHHPGTHAARGEHASRHGRRGDDRIRVLRARDDGRRWR